MKTKAVSDAVEYMSLNKALQYCGVSKCAWHYTKKFKAIPLDASVTYKVRQIASRRPTYGTRRMAAQISRETGMSTNRKKIQRIYRKIGWNEPQKTKNDIIRTSKRKRFKPTGPNQLWETDITYIHCGRNDGVTVSTSWTCSLESGQPTCLTPRPRPTLRFSPSCRPSQRRWESSRIETQDRQRFTVHQP